MPNRQTTTVNVRSFHIRLSSSSSEAIITGGHQCGSPEFSGKNRGKQGQERSRSFCGNLCRTIGKRPVCPHSPKNPTRKNGVWGTRPVSASEKNTQLVMDNCFHAIMAAWKM